MAGAGIDKLARGGAEAGQHQGDEPSVGHILDERAVGQLHHFADVAARQHQCTQVGPRLGHDQRRADPVPTDVANDYAQMV